MPEGRETPTPCDHGAHYGDGEGRRVCVEYGAPHEPGCYLGTTPR